MSAPLLSATLIVRDEAENLPACLGSVAPIADEIVVVDTGSVDGSAEIARAHGAIVLEHEWRDDFAAARNVALDAARGTWILYVDADERLRDVQPAAVSERLAGADEAAFRIHLRPFANSTPFLEYRLWRASPEIRFRGVIHEQVVEDIHELAGREGRPIADWPELALDHIGYDGDQAAKNRRNLPLLRRRLEADPANIFSWRHLARVLEATGDEAGAEDALERAVALARGERTPSSHGSLAWGDLVRLRHERGVRTSPPCSPRAGSAGRRTTSSSGSRATCCSTTAASTMRRRAFAASSRSTPTGLAPGGVAYDERIFGAFSWSSLGLAEFRAGRYADAAAAYAEAARLEPDNPEHAAKRALAAARDER